jgi:hypothetical protein
MRPWPTGEVIGGPWDGVLLEGWLKDLVLLTARKLAASLWTRP